MKEKKRYVLLHSSSLDALEKKINEHDEWGYSPVGGPTYGESGFGERLWVILLFNRHS